MQKLCKVAVSHGIDVRWSCCMPSPASMAGITSRPPSTAAAPPLLQDLSLKPKKKKKAKKRQEGDHLDEEPAAGEQDAGQQGEGKYPWSGSSRDYEYSELLTRIYDTLTKHNPQLGGHYRKNVINPPDIQRDGIRKSVFNNF